MSQATNPFRQRAGHLSTLVKGFAAAREIMQNDGSIEEALEMIDKLNDIYKAYLKSHDLAMETNEDPKRDKTLIDSFMRYEQRHDQVLDELNEFIHDGTKPDPSSHGSSRASSKSSMKTANTTILSVNRSNTSSTSQARLSEARVQAELAKTDVENLRKLQEAQQKKLQLEREEAQRRLKLDEENRRIEMERRILKEETERRRQELDNQIEMQRRVAELEKLRAEVHIREQEEVRSQLGSDYESDEEIEDVTRPEITGKPQTVADVSSMRETINMSSRIGYQPPITEVQTKVPAFPIRVENTAGRNPCEIIINSKPQPREKPSEVQCQSNMALFSRVLRESRLPSPKILTFDGDPKRYKMFMASFMSNVDERLDDSDYKMKLTLLLQHCTGDALNLIEDCVILQPEQGYTTALQKLEKRFGKNHQIAQAYINGVTKGHVIKLNDVKALVDLSDKMQKCQSVLSALKFCSDLDSTGTLLSIMERLPEPFQNKWVRRSQKILMQEREPNFKDMAAFVEELANDYSSKYGLSYAERMLEKSKESTGDATTLATDTESMAGQERKPKCLHCDRVGHVIWKCFKFKKLSTDDRRAVVNRRDLCVCCLKHGHEESTCDRTCFTCGGDHHSLLHPDDITDDDNDQENQN